MPDKFPLVSVVICFFNEENFLEQAIQSVLDQTYTNLEVLLVDDGSANKSTRIAKFYVDNYPDTIRYFEHENHSNKGLSASRNKGIEHARGNIIAFLDADDTFNPGYLEHQVNLAIDTEATMICEATKYWYSWNNQNKDDEIIPIGTLEDKLYQPQELNLLLYPLNGLFAAPCMCGVIVQKEVLIKHGGFEESFTGMYEDQVFLAKMYYNEPVYISSVCNNNYRQRSDSMMSTAQKKEDYIKIRIQFLEWFKSYLKKNNGKNTKIYKHINRLLLPHQYPRYYNNFYVLPKRIIKKAYRVFNI